MRKDLAIGSQVYFYKPPDQAKVHATGRKVKHLAHYQGPATISAKIGSSSYKLEFQGKPFQRDGGMLVPFRDMPDSFELTDDEPNRKPVLHHMSMPFREGEFILTKDDMNAGDWYCAEVSEVLTDRIKVNYYTTITPPLDEYENK